MICTIGGGLKLHSNFLEEAKHFEGKLLKKGFKDDISISLIFLRAKQLRKGKSHTGYRSFSL